MRQFAHLVILACLAVMTACAPYRVPLQAGESAHVARMGNETISCSMNMAPDPAAINSGTCAHGVSSPRGASASRQRSSSTQRRVNLLIKQLKHNDAAVRTNAATDLGAIGPGAHDAIEPLAQAARDDSSKWVRRAAVKSLPRISSGPRVVDVLAAACNDKDRWVAQSAEKVLRRMRSKPAPKASPLTRE